MENRSDSFLNLSFASKTWRLFVCDLLVSDAALPRHCRLLHGPSLVEVGLSVAYETWFRLAGINLWWLLGLKYRLGLSHVAVQGELMWPMWISTGFHVPLPVILHNPNGPAGIYLPLGMCKGIAKKSTATAMETAPLMCHLGGTRWYRLFHRPLNDGQMPDWRAVQVNGFCKTGKIYIVHVSL